LQMLVSTTVGNTNGILGGKKKRTVKKTQLQVNERRKKVYLWLELRGQKPWHYASTKRRRYRPQVEKRRRGKTSNGSKGGDWSPKKRPTPLYLAHGTKNWERVKPSRRGDYERTEISSTAASEGVLASADTWWNKQKSTG